MSSDKINRGLDEIIADKRSNGSRSRRAGGSGDRRRDRQEYPRDGVKKSLRSESRNLDSEWVHDRYEENNTRRGPAPRRRRESPANDGRGAKLRVENIHYDLTEEDLEELFRRIGPITKLQLRYDRSGRSEGVAFVTYQENEDALEAIKQFDGANANGQPIRLSMLSNGASRNPFDSAVMPGRPLSERISAPGGGRSRSLSPPRRLNKEDAARKGIDRYIPGSASNSRSRSPMPPRRGGRRPGARREGRGKESEAMRGGGGRGGAPGGRSTPRLKKTQEELDAEMEDYFSTNAAGADELTADSAAVPAPIQAAAQPQTDDIDMIE